MVLSFKYEANVKNGVTYQLFSFLSGEWGPVKRSAKFKRGIAMADMRGRLNDMVVCRGSVYCLIRVSHDRQCVFSIDVLTERTWTTKLPDKFALPSSGNIVLATSEDGQLSVISPLVDHLIEVWVLGGGGDEWTLQRAINLHNLIPSCPKWRRDVIRAFCPRSGCLFVDIDNKDVLLIDINTGSLRLIRGMCVGPVNLYPYEVDWSTYISKMKYF